HFSRGGFLAGGRVGGCVPRWFRGALPAGLGYSLAAQQNFAKRGVISQHRNERVPAESVARRRHNLRSQLAQLCGASVMEVKMTMSRRMNAFMTGVAPALIVVIAMPQPRI